jgi:NAD(P)-dependent dehydrogenase (short-subunit alcohol dehydrogenase family)
LRVALADRTPCTARPIAGAALILGTNALSAALAEKIRVRGGRAVLLDAEQPVETLLAEIDRLTAGADPVHLFLATPHDADATAVIDAKHWESRRKQGVVLPYLVCQRWYSRMVEGDRLSRSILIAVTALGGEFGFARHERSPESGALCGLVKAVWFETGMSGPGLSAKVVDLNVAESPETLAAYVLEEIDRGQPDVEVGYGGGRRCVVRPKQESVPSPTAEPERGGVWVISGGARGVTAIVARELGRRFGLKLHLLGTSPAPNIDPAWRERSHAELRELKTQITRQALAERRIPAEAWQSIERALEIDRNLQAMAADGVAATYHRCDVADREALARTLSAIRADDGPIHGIVHGAGVEQSCRFEKKQPAMLQRTLAAKVDGAAHLIDVTQGDPLRYFLAFGSISGRFGNFGQADYSLANEMLAKLVTWLRTTRPEVRATTFQWHSWAEVGMAVRPESKHAKTKKNMQFMPPLEGAAHLIDELCAGLPESEVLITDVNYFRSFYP